MLAVSFLLGFYWWHFFTNLFRLLKTRGSSAWVRVSIYNTVITGVYGSLRVHYCSMMALIHETKYWMFAIAYTMMALLYESVSAFEDMWIECLGEGFNI